MTRNYMYGMPQNIDLKTQLPRKRPFEFQYSFAISRTKRFTSLFSSEPLFDLIDAAANGNRIQELMLVTRPGDIWDYVWLKYNENLDPDLANHIGRIRTDYAQTQLGKLNPWPDECVPMPEFEALLNWSDEFVQHFFKAYISKTERTNLDCSQFTNIWLVGRFSSLLPAYARLHFHHVLIAKAALDLKEGVIDNQKLPAKFENDVYSTMSRQQIMVANRLIDKNKLHYLA